MMYCASIYTISFNVFLCCHITVYENLFYLEKFVTRYFIIPMDSNWEEIFHNMFAFVSLVYSQSLKFCCLLQYDDEFW